MVDVIIEGDAEGCAAAAELINQIVKERVCARRSSIADEVKLRSSLGYQGHSHHLLLWISLPLHPGSQQGQH